MLLCALSWAATPAHYHPDTVASHSERFARSADALGPRFSAAEAEVARLESLVASLELGTALLAGDAGEGLRAWTTSNRRAFSGQFLLLNQALGKVQDDLSGAFVAALERALPVVGKGYEVKECGATGVAALVGRTNCAGEDLNPALGKAIDADADLGRALDEVLGRTWPTLRLEPGPQQVVPLRGEQRSVQLVQVVRQFAGPAVNALLDQRDADLEELEVAVAARDEAARAKAGAIRASTDQALGALGASVRSAVAAALDRSKKAPTDLGWCANPEGLGGCGVPDATAELVRLLAADKKFLAEVGR